MVVSALFLLLLSLVPEAVVSELRCTRTRCTTNKNFINFFFFGDWGGLPLYPYSSFGQKKVAKTMTRLVPRWRTDFILALGDNFYLTGVKNVDDFRFEESFEDVYKKGSIRKIPWYVVAGNHDHYGNVSAQIAYTKKSHRWTFPNLYYPVRYETADGVTVDILMIDTIVLCGKSRDVEFSTSVLSYFLTPSSEPDSPKDPEKARQELEWIEQQLAESNADFLFVAGHYPMYSAGDHGPNRCLLDSLLPLLTRHRVSAYFSGHDHNLQHLVVDKDGSELNFVVSGAAAFIHDSSDHEADLPEGSLRFNYPKPTWYSLFRKIGVTQGAFVSATVKKSGASFDFIRGDARKVYSFSIPPRSLDNIE